MVRQKALTILTNQELSARVANADDRSRSAYWKPSHDFAANQLSPQGKESLRTQAVGGFDRRVQSARGGQQLYQAKSTYYEQQHGAPKLDNKKFLPDQRVQALYSANGDVQRKPTHIPDHSPSNNVNNLRFEREQHFVDNLLMDGGAEYNPAVCVGNWVEERRDRNFRSGFHARELGMSQIYMSEHMDRYRPKTASYAERVSTLYRTAKMPDTDKKVDANESDGTHLYYCRGFGDTYQLDHTIPTKRGGFWVGAAPVKDGESVNTTAMHQNKLEFQKRVCYYDRKSRVLTGPGKEVEEEQAAKETALLTQSEKHAANWKTMYTTEIVQKASTSNAYRPVSVSQEWKTALSLRRPQSCRV